VAVSEPTVPDDLALLTGEEAGDLLRAALAAEGGELRSWQARSVDVRPGGGATASYRAEVTGSDGARSVWLGASTRRLPAGVDPGSVLQLHDGVRTVSVWAWPRDPWLPALPAACDARAVEDLLVSFGAATGPVRLTVRAYRPGRRAVLEGRSSRGHLYVKVLRPGRVHDLHARHRLLSEAGVPVPAGLGWRADGLLALQALPGTSARDRLRRGGPLPEPAAVLDLLDRLPAAVLDLPPRPSWTDGAWHYAGLLAAALTSAGRLGDADRVRGLAERLTGELAMLPRDPEPVHGDLYEAQLLLDDDGRVTGLLDLDSAGPGRRADDLACVVAHLEVLALLPGWPAASLRELAGRWASAFAGRVDPRELRLRTAGVLLSLATGPHRVQEAEWPAATALRLDAVERQLVAAGS
jgi:hypothetical protein